MNQPSLGWVAGDCLPLSRAHPALPPCCMLCHEYEGLHPVRLLDGRWARVCCTVMTSPTFLDLIAPNQKANRWPW